MIDYEKLKTELNDYALYLLNSLKRDYGAHFSLQNQKKLNKLLKTENIVEIDELVDNKKIHINPNYEIFKTENYNEIKNYILNNYLINSLLNCFITLSIPEKEFVQLEEPNENESCRICLRKGLISLIGLEFATKCRLTNPTVYSEQSYEFILFLQENYKGFNLKSYAFLDDYLYLKQKFLEYTKEDILAVYKKYKAVKAEKLKNMKDELIMEIEILEDDDDFSRTGR